MYAPTEDSEEQVSRDKHDMLIVTAVMNAEAENENQDYERVMGKQSDNGERLT